MIIHEFWTYDARCVIIDNQMKKKTNTIGCKFGSRISGYGVTRVISPFPEEFVDNQK